MRRLGILLALTALTALASSPAARADTAFGGDPRQPINTTLSCASGVPTGNPTLPFYVGSGGAPSCMWTWNNPAVGSDVVPFPVTGGSGTITSVTLPAMPNPGPMAVVVLTAGLNSSGNPAQPQSICCQVKQVGPAFTVPPNQIATVAQNLRVSATESANPNVPGDTSFGDLVGLAVLSPTASLPVRYTGNAGIPNYDGVYSYYPAPAPSGEFREPFNTVGFQLLANFNLTPDAAAGGGAGGGGATPAGGGQSPAAGLRLSRGALRAAADGRTVRLGSVANPPTARTIQTLTLPRAARAAAARAAKAKPKLLGRSRTRVAAGRTVALKLKLNRAGKQRLRKQGKLRAKLKVVAFGASGETRAVTRTVTIKPPKQKQPRRRG